MCEDLSIVRKHHGVTTVTITQGETSGNGILTQKESHFILVPR